MENRSTADPFPNHLKNLSKKKGGKRRVFEKRSSRILMKLCNLKLGPISPILSKYTPLYQTKFTKLNLINQAKCVRCEDPNILNQIYQSNSWAICKLH